MLNPLRHTCQMLGEELVPQEATIRNLYVHVPFCTHICPYCSFYKTRNLSGPMRLFLPALLKEIEVSLECLPLNPETVFFGGGTPSALSVSQLRELSSFWPWKSVEEFTLEANPMTISERKAQCLLELGVNRISLGVQAFDEQSLKLLGRTHRAEDIEKTVERLRQSGFRNVNIDLMFALPGQSVAMWKENLDRALCLEPEHLSLYELTYEEDTEFLSRLESGDLREESTGREMHEWAIDRLEGQGFRHYEVSNFARPGREARHNQACWKGEDYLGLGPSACSTVGNHRWKTVADIHSYGENPLQRQWEMLDPEIRIKEKVILGLRTDRGIEREWIEGKEDFLEDLKKQGLLENSGSRIILSSRGRLLADSITEELI